MDSSEIQKIKDQLREYAGSYYQHTAVEPEYSNIFKMYVPEVDAKFLLGLGKFEVQIVRIKATPDARLCIVLRKGV